MAASSSTSSKSKGGKVNWLFPVLYTLSSVGVIYSATGFKITSFFSYHVIGAVLAGLWCLPMALWSVKSKRVTWHAWFQTLFALLCLGVCTVIYMIKEEYSKPHLQTWHSWAAAGFVGLATLQVFMAWIGMPPSSTPKQREANIAGHKAGATIIILLVLATLFLGWFSLSGNSDNYLEPQNVFFIASVIVTYGSLSFVEASPDLKSCSVCHEKGHYKTTCLKKDLNNN